MSATQFAMVEELASLVKDNLHSKHLVLSTEEALISILQEQTCSEDDENYDREHDGVTAPPLIELQPASGYHRLLLHRLAEIYGFAHESVGEGDDRRLVLQRCPEAAIPPVLVSDVLWQYDNTDESSSVVLTRNYDNTDDSSSVMLTRNATDIQKTRKAEVVQEDISAVSSHVDTEADLKPKPSVVVPGASLKEREAAYRAARERIFSTDDAKGKNPSSTKSRQVPVVAQRMIAHALGKKVYSPTETIASTEVRGKQQMNGPNVPKSSRNFYPVTPDNREVSSVRITKSNSSDTSSYETPGSQRSRTTRAVSAESLKREQTGAAKRMFAHALGLPIVQGSNGTASKPK